MTGKTFSREITSPIDLIQDAQSPARNHLAHATISLTNQQVADLQNICETITAPIETALASRDWWPLTMHWALAGEVPTRAAAICRPTSTEQVSHVLSYCNEHKIPVTAAGGRSGVCGASIPLYGGVILDTTAMQGVVALDDDSLTVEVLPGTFGPDLEAPSSWEI